VDVSSLLAYTPRQWNVQIWSKVSKTETRVSDESRDRSSVTTVALTFRLDFFDKRYETSSLVLKAW